MQQADIPAVSNKFMATIVALARQQPWHKPTLYCLLCAATVQKSYSKLQTFCHKSFQHFLELQLLLCISKLTNASKLSGKPTHFTIKIIQNLMFWLCRIKCSKLLNLSNHNTAPQLQLLSFFANTSQSTLFSSISENNRPAHLYSQQLTSKTVLITLNKKMLVIVMTFYLYWLPTSGPCPNTCLESWLAQNTSKSWL